MLISSGIAYLRIEVTERPTSRIHNLTNSRRFRRIAHIELVPEACFPRLRLVRPSDVAIIATVHLFFGTATRWVKQLPVRPHPIHHAVVDVKCWVAGAGEKIATGVATGRDY